MPVIDSLLDATAKIRNRRLFGLFLLGHSVRETRKEGRA
jgi:hypothetical protein